MKNPIHFILNFFIIGCIVSCKKEPVKTTKLILENKDVIQPKATIITGTSDDPQAFEYLNFLSLDIPKKELKLENFKVPNQPDSIYFKTEDLLESQYTDLLAFGIEKVYQLPIFITPGDSIHINIKNEELSVVGTHKSHYQFYKDIDLNEYPLFSNVTRPKIRLHNFKHYV